MLLTEFLETSKNDGLASVAELFSGSGRFMAGATRKTEYCLDPYWAIDFQ